MTTAERDLMMLYSLLPALPCQRKCQHSCGPIEVTQAELARMQTWNGYHVQDSQGPKEDCQFLQDGLCSVYPVRPMICRLWGLVKTMACPFGCVPSRWLSDEEAGWFLEEAQLISGGKPVILRVNKEEDGAK